MSSIDDFMSKGGVLLSQNQKPIMSGLNINGQVITINELVAMDDKTFKETMLAVIIHLCGGIYSPPPMPTGPSSTVQATVSADATVIKASDVKPEDLV